MKVIFPISFVLVFFTTFIVLRPKPKINYESSTRMKSSFLAPTIGRSHVKNKTNAIREEKRHSLPNLPFTRGAKLRNIDYNNYTEEDSGYLKLRLPEMLSRTERVADGCAKWKSYKFLNIPTHHTLWDVHRKPKLFSCLISKVASTTWLSNFLKLKHFHPNRKRKVMNRKERLNPVMKNFGNKSKRRWSSQRKAYHLFPPPEDEIERLHILKDSIRVVEVRHPFRRLLSSYLFKYVRHGTRDAEQKMEFKKLGDIIIQKYRLPNQTLSLSEKGNPDPTFSEFVQYIITDLKAIIRAGGLSTNTNKLFQEQTNICNICSYDYTLILKMESHDEDQRFLSTFANLEEIKQGVDDNKFLRFLRHSTTSGLSEVMQHYAQLTKKQIEELYLVYQKDFDILNYSIDEFLDVAMSEHNDS